MFAVDIEIGREKIMALKKAKYYEQYLKSVPREEWIRRKKTDDHPGITKGPHWSTEPEDNLPCHGERMKITVRDGIEVPVILYRPQEVKEKTPIHFHIHGGGFSFGHAELNDYELSLYRDELGIYTVGIDFILAPERQFPEQLYDCYDVVKYFVDHADEYNIDVKRMSVGGESSGGNSATVLARMAAEGNDFKFRMQWIGYSAMDLYHDFKDESKSTAGSIEGSYMYYGSYCDRKKAKNSYISPFFATTEELRCMPATVYVMADDHLLGDNMVYAKKLIESGVTVRMKTFVGANHCFNLHWPDTWGGELGEEALAYTLDGFRDYLL